MKKMFLELDENSRVVGLGSSPPTPESVEVEIEEDHEVLLQWTSFLYIDKKLIKDTSLLLDSAKKTKDDELNQNCKEAILAGFNHIINGETYWFSYDMEAQGNFRDGREVLKDGLVESLPWTVRAGGIDGPYTRIVVNFEIISELTIAAMIHKTEKISKYRDFLMPIVEGATSIEEIEEIQW